MRKQDEWLHVGVVERWNAHVGIRQDLFGFIDLIAIRDDCIAAIQVTAYGKFGQHLTKINEDEQRRRAAVDWIEAGGELYFVCWRQMATLLKSGAKAKRKAWVPMVHRAGVTSEDQIELFSDVEISRVSDSAAETSEYTREQVGTA